MNSLPYDVINLVASREGVDAKLLAAVAQHESSGNQWAIRYEPSYHYLYKPQDFAGVLNCSLDTEVCLQKFSFGYMQLMGAVARQLGFKGNFGELFSPETNLTYGARHLKNYLNKYEDNVEDALSAYNAGSPRKTGAGRYVNQQYVSDVLRLFAKT